MLATIFGTVPAWWTAARTRPLETGATPGTAAICFAELCGKVSWVPGRKKSWTNLSPGLPSFERSVITDWFAWITSRPPPPKPTATEAAALAAGVLLGRERHRQVGADAGQRDRAPSPAPRRGHARAPRRRSRARPRARARARSGSSGSCGGRARSVGSRRRTSRSDESRAFWEHPENSGRDRLEPVTSSLPFGAAELIAFVAGAATGARCGLR